MKYKSIFIIFLFFFINQVSYSDSLKNINLFHEVPIFNNDGSVNAVIKIPSGENQKSMVSKKTGKLEWEKNYLEKIYPEFQKVVWSCFRKKQI